ncbi:hypothetical protein ES706_05249 [subsurface metagenome]
MRPAEIERMKELVQEVCEDERGFYALPIDESLELERLLRKKIGELEFGFPICGEE